MYYLLLGANPSLRLNGESSSLLRDPNFVAFMKNHASLVLLALYHSRAHGPHRLRGLLRRKEVCNLSFNWRNDSLDLSSDSWASKVSQTSLIEEKRLK